MSGRLSDFGKERHCRDEYTQLKPKSILFLTVEYVGYIKKTAAALHH